MKLGETIRSTRRYLDIDQRELGDAVGVSKTTIHTIERNPVYSPGFYLVMRIIKHLNKNIEKHGGLKIDPLAISSLK